MSFFSHKKQNNTATQEFIAGLERRNHELDAIYNAIDRSMAIIEFDTDCKVITANENFLKLMGYTLEEIKGKHHSMFCDQKLVSSPLYKQGWDQLRSGQFKQGKFKRIAKGGKELYLEATYNPVLDNQGKVVKIVKIATDITQRILEFNDLRAVHNAALASMALIEFDTEGRVITANKNFLKVVGYSLDEIEGKHHSIFCDPEFVKTPQYTEFWQHLKSGEFKQGTFKRVTKTGKAVYLEASYNPVFDSEGKIYKFIEICLGHNGQGRKDFNDFEFD
ncbi:hypothetical protein NHP190012_07270 [Helicobacter sp. NHP19-012]|uniref:PAS domain-containing protein n=1 Tax=Helicobacter gastrofelis TaxID=2849642 RepID=A0ABM7SNB4_9HELI|nr:hypothetical protein NHP190012_07270 [Helicobacter sp. NHP19-012]